MTAGEAIHVLAGYKVAGMRNGKTQLCEALRLAIAALRAQQGQTPCSRCGYGGKHLDAPPCTQCPAHPKEGKRNEPLTLDELRQMDGEPVWVVSAIGERPEWYIVDAEENELANPWDRICLVEWDNGWPYSAYRHKPEPPEDNGNGNQ